MEIVKRLQRKRTKSWRKPDNSVYVGRPSKWGNPYKAVYSSVYFNHPTGWVFIHRLPTHEKAVKFSIQRYKDKILTGKFVKEVQQELKGKNLLCWCKEGEPCHGDILLEIAK